MASAKRKRKAPAKLGRSDGDAKDPATSAKRKRTVKKEEGSSDLSSLSDGE